MRHYTLAILVLAIGLAGSFTSPQSMAGDARHHRRDQPAQVERGRAENSGHTHPLRGHRGEQPAARVDRPRHSERPAIRPPVRVDRPSRGDRHPPVAHRPPRGGDVHVSPRHDHRPVARPVGGHHYDPAPPRHHRDRVVIRSPSPRHHVHRHRPGHWLRVLPRLYFHLNLGAVGFYYADGLFYQPLRDGYVVVNAPLGVIVPSLPDDYTLILLNGQFYYIVGDTYYVRVDGGYRVVSSPVQAAPLAEAATPAEPSRQLVIYPAQGQSEEQQARDRYECHRWSAQQSGYDPSAAEPGAKGEPVDFYYRAMGACLEARGYTVK